MVEDNVLPANQTQILYHIALDGPIDAYRANRDLNLRLTTTQLVFKKLRDTGLIRLKETVIGETKQNRNVYGLTPLGFCVVTESILRKNSVLTMEQLKDYIYQNGDIFPDLLKRWEFLTEKTREYYLKNPVENWQHDEDVISFPDIATEIWCKLLWRVCKGLLFGYTHNGIITLESIRDQYHDYLVRFACSGVHFHQTDGIIYAITQDKEFWNSLAPTILNQLDFHKTQQIYLEKLLAIK